MANYLRAYRQEDDGDSGPLTFVASTGGIKRDGLDLEQERWRLENYRLNPVVLWAHDYWGGHLPIGRADVVVNEGQLMARVDFDQEDAFARAIEGKYRRGFLNAVSVGWDVVDEDGETVPWNERYDEDTEHFYDLLDISAVPVPGDPDALLERQERALRGLRDALDLILDDAPESQGNDGVGGAGDSDLERIMERLVAMEKGLTRLVELWNDDGPGPEEADPDLVRLHGILHQEE